MSYSRSSKIVRVLEFDRITVGDSAELSHTIGQDDVDAFAALTGDFNPLHVDESFSRRTAFRRPVVHGMLSAAFISTLIGTLLPGSGALWTSQTLEFLAPAFVGDVLTVFATVEQKSVSARLLVLKIVIANQHGNVLIKGKSHVKVLEVKKEPTASLETKSRVVLVTGASKGIGAAIAANLSGQGHAVAINYCHSEQAARDLAGTLTAKGLKAFAVKADVSQDDAVREMFAAIESKMGPVDDVVHCAAPLPIPTPFAELSWQVFQDQIDTQVRGAFNCAKAALPNMIAGGDGSLLFIGSIYADNVPPPQQAAYVVAKAALTAMARALAVEYGPKGIRANVIAPGMTETDMISRLPDKIKMLTKMQTPLRRLGISDDVAHVAQFLISSNARHITGQTIRVDGGITMA